MYSGKNRDTPVVVKVAVVIIVVAVIVVFLLAIGLCDGVSRRGRNFVEGVLVGAENLGGVFDNLMKSVNVVGRFVSGTNVADYYGADCEDEFLY